MAYKNPENQTAWRHANKDKWAQYHKTWRTNNPEKHKSNYRDISPERKTYYSIKSKCKRKDIPFNLTIEDFEAPDVCPVLGIKLDRSCSNNTPSVDRINPLKGYTKGNTKIISLRANRMKQDSTIEDLELILKYMKDNS